MKKIIILILVFSSIILSQEIDFSQIKNWTAADTIDQYDSSNLWEYINGAADLFYTYGFQNLHSCEMTSGDIEVVVDVYNMGNRLNTFGMYKTERGDLLDKLEVGVEAVITSPHQSLMLKDIYYIKLNVYEGSLSEDIHKQLLQSIADMLPGSNNFPSEFQLLPIENKILNSEGFAKESYLGLSDLKNCLYADYKENENEFQYFIIIPESEETFEIIWNKFSEKWKIEESSDILYKKIPYSGLVGMVKIKNGILGVTNSSNKSELQSRLKIFN